MIDAHNYVDKEVYDLAVKLDPSMKDDNIITHRME